MPEEILIDELRKRWVALKEIESDLELSYNEARRWVDKITRAYLLTEKKEKRDTYFKILSLQDFDNYLANA